MRFGSLHCHARFSGRVAGIDPEKIEPGSLPVEALQNSSLVVRSCVSRVVWRTRVIENVECYARLAPVMTYRASGQAKNSREQLQRNPAFRKRRPKGDVNASAARPARRRRGTSALETLVAQRLFCKL